MDMIIPVPDDGIKVKCIGKHLSNVAKCVKFISW